MFYHATREIRYQADIIVLATAIHEEGLITYAPKGIGGGGQASKNCHCKKGESGLK